MKYFQCKENAEAKKKSDFLEKIAAECSEELEFDLAQAKKLLLGDLSIDSREAKVRKNNKKCE